jgi:predicted ribosomally synthesized peptide with SipW-like signal peptide
MGRRLLSPLAATGMLGLAVVVASGTGTTLAQWQDEATFSGHTLKAGKVHEPLVGCETDGGALDLDLALEGAYLTLAPGEGGVPPNSYFVYEGTNVPEQVPGDTSYHDVGPGTYTVEASLAEMGEGVDSAWKSAPSAEVTVTWELVSLDPAVLGEVCGP